MNVINAKAHGILDYAVVILFFSALPALPWLLTFSAEIAARNFYVGVGAGIFFVWLISDYRTHPQTG